jgi:transposase
MCVYVCAVLRHASVSVQEYCRGCSKRLDATLIRRRHRYHPQCQPKPTSSSPAIEPPPLFPPFPSLFGREPGIHLPLSPIERSAAVVLTRIGEPQQQAAEQLGTTRQTVAHWQHTFEETRDIIDVLRSGRPRDTTDQENITIVASCVIHSHLTPKGVLQELDLNVSARTIDRRLQEAGLFGRVAMKKRVFTEEDKRKRLSFAEGYRHWKEADWE